MMARVPWQRIQYFSSVSIVYLLTLLFAVYLLRPWQWLRHPVYANTAAVLQSVPTDAHQAPAVTGTPVRIVITQSDNGLNIDLPVEIGVYDRATNSWTLSDTHADFAAPSLPPNDRQGLTLIYGHDKPDVFGYLNAIRPGTDAHVVLYTNNGHTFTYTYDSFTSLKADNTSIFKSDGPPTLIVQTCGGSFFQYRQMFSFHLTAVDGHVVR